MSALQPLQPKPPAGPKAHIKHGFAYTPEYRAWQTMRQRCTNPKCEAYPDYGGRGITVCDRWLNDVSAFIADMGPKPSPRHELDRERNNEGYSPSNCRWVIRPVNCRNRRSNRMLEFAGETLTLIEWSERSGVPPSTITKRLGAGWPMEKVLGTPARPKAPAGQAKPCKPMRPCVDCAARLTSGERCKSCENRRRAQWNSHPELRAAA